MQERNQTFKEAVNDAIRAGSLATRPSEPFVTQAASLGESRVNLDRALQLAADIEDDELIRKMQLSS